MDDEELQSADDALESGDRQLEIGETPLDQDFEAPGLPADDIKSGLPIDYPLTDAEIDTHELYDENMEVASGYDDQHSESEEDPGESLINNDFEEEE